MGEHRTHCGLLRGMELSSECSVDLCSGGALLLGRVGLAGTEIEQPTHARDLRAQALVLSLKGGEGRVGGRGHGNHAYRSMRPLSLHFDPTPTQLHLGARMEQGTGAPSLQQQPNAFISYDSVTIRCGAS